MSGRSLFTKLLNRSTVRRVQTLQKNKAACDPLMQWQDRDWDGCFCATPSNLWGMSVRKYIFFKKKRKQPLRTIGPPFDAL